MTTKKLTRIVGNEFCTMEVRLDTLGVDTGIIKQRLSITGSHGEVMTKAQAKRYTLDFWESYFDEDANNIKAMNDRCGTNFRSSKSAARYVYNTDGLLGDMAEHENGKILYVTSCGQICEELHLFFPEHAQYFKWHLNDMRSDCEHQEARGDKDSKNTDGSYTYPVCPDCGHKYGSAWLYRPLPPEVITWFDSL